MQIERNQIGRQIKKIDMHLTLLDCASEDLIKNKNILFEITQFIDKTFKNSDIFSP